MTKSESRLGIEQTAREIWATRPHRPEADRKIGGVAAAIGLRYDIDPVLVRVAFVVITVFSGVGVLLYLLGWLLLPGEGDSSSPAESLLGRGRSATSPVVTVLLGLALIPAAGMAFGSKFTGLIGLALATAAVFLLHRSRSELGQVPTPAGPAAPPGATGTSPTAPATPTPGADGPNATAATAAGGAGEPVPPAWDPLGAAPFAWDLPEPGPPPPPVPPPPRRPRSKVTPVTLGLALLAGGAAAAFWPGLSLVQLSALVLGVVGAGLVVGSLVRGGRGLLGVAIPLVLLIVVLQTVPMTNPMSGLTVGDRRWEPTSAAQLAPRYELTVGNGELDLTGLRLAPGQTVHTSVAVGVGQARVVLPPGLDAQVSCTTPVGSVDCLDVTNSGLPARGAATGVGSDGPGGGTLVLDVRSGLGNVSVERQP